MSEALTKLGESTAEACLGVLEMFAADKVSTGEVTTFTDPKQAFAGVPVPCVAMSVSYVDGVTGGNVFLITLDGARNLAASMMGMDEPEDPDAEELSELELSAVSEAMNQMMATAAAATSVVLGNEVEISTPDTKMFTSADDVAAAYPATPHAVRIAMSICGEPARLVQLVPNAFVVRMSSALDDMGSEIAGGPTDTPAGGRRTGLHHGEALFGRDSGPRLGRARASPDAFGAGGRPAGRRRRRARQAGRRRHRFVCERNQVRDRPPGRRGWNRLGCADRARPGQHQRQ